MLRRPEPSLFALVLAVFLLAGPSVSVSATAQAREAQLQDDVDGLYRRALTLPGAVLRSRPIADAPVVVDQVPAFTVYYVYADRNGWLEVGPTPSGGAAGWLSAETVEDWKSMLVMEYAPAGQRGRVPFFQERDPLAALLAAPDRPVKVADLRRAIAAHEPDARLLAAVEPAAVVDRRSRPYLMPILDWTWAEAMDGSDVTLVQIGGLNAADEDDERTGNAGADLSEFRIGLVFVVDTTLSMGPYIDRTYATVEAIYDELERSGALDRVAFGMVGYRDHLGHDPGIDYTTRVYQDLSLDTPPEAILKNLERVRPLTVSTDGWDEDVFAGLTVAIEELNWEPFDARLIVLVTDAGARPANDPNAAYPGIDGQVLSDAANRRGISIFPIHLRTEEAGRLGDLEAAERLYRELGETGDSNANKYVGIEAGSVKRFGETIGAAVTQIHRSIEKAAENSVTAAPENLREGDMAGLLVNEVFRAQMEFIGRTTGTTAPTFYRAWAADRDLANPRLDALRVSVFLNRTQLSALAQGLRAIVEQAKAADLDPGSFFDSLQGLATTMATDANRAGSSTHFADLAASSLLPGFLETLPYHSKVLMLNRDLWLDWGLSGQQEFILELDSKIAIYDALDRDTANWVDLGAGEPGLEVYPMPLRYLP